MFHTPCELFHAELDGLLDGSEGDLNKSKTTKQVAAETRMKMLRISFVAKSVY
jgi:hypothetical protein